MEIAKIHEDGTIEVGHFSKFKRITAAAGKAAILFGGFIECTRYRPHDPLTHRLVESEPHIEGEWCYLVRVQPLTEREIAAQKASALDALRRERNQRLNECAWTQEADERAILGAVKSAQWDIYRQAVRNVPYTAMDPRIPVTWPTPPTA